MKGRKTKDEKKKMSVQRQGVKLDSLSRRSSLRSSGNPDLLYDFKEDSPKAPDIVKQTKKNLGKSKVTRQTGSRGPQKNVTKPTQNKGKRDLQVTPKVAGRKKLTSMGEMEENYKQKKVKKKIKPLPPPNFDDVSPVVMNPTKRRSNRCSKEQTPPSYQNVGNTKKSKNKSNLPLDSPRLSIIEPEHAMSDDSAIFVSFGQRSPDSSENEKTSTPAIVPCKMSKKDSKIKQPKQYKIVKDTSTPCEVRQTRAFTRLKTVEPECSPVQRNETPTSDYGSMDAIDSPVMPSPVSEKKSKRKRGSSPTPAFSLEDEYEAEPLSLNRSVSINYSNQKTKKKMKTNRYSISKVEEWANKVNSELEDIENFELSIED